LSSKRKVLGFVFRVSGFRFRVSGFDCVVSNSGWSIHRKVDVGLPGKENSNSHGARPVHQIISMIKGIRTRRLSIQNSLSLKDNFGGGCHLPFASTSDLSRQKSRKMKTGVGSLQFGVFRVGVDTHLFKPGRQEVSERVRVPWHLHPQPCACVQEGNTLVNCSS